MRLIIGLLYSLKLDKKDKYINRFEWIMSKLLNAWEKIKNWKI